MDIKPVAWMLDVESCTSMSAPLAQASRGGNYADPLYPQSAIEALTAEVERLREVEKFLRSERPIARRMTELEAEAARLRQELAAMKGEG